MSALPPQVTRPILVDVRCLSNYRFSLLPGGPRKIRKRNRKSATLLWNRCWGGWVGGRWRSAPHQRNLADKRGGILSALNGCPARVVNDVEAVAFALPLLQPDDRFPIGLIKAPSSKPRTLLVVNVGTGFGAAALVSSGVGWASVPGEAGHMNFRTYDKKNGLVVDASVESILSGTGVATLMAGFGPKDGSHGIEYLAAPIAGGSEDVIGQRDPNLEGPDFDDLLGEVAGNLALATGAWGGVFFCGGVIDAWKKSVDQMRFRSRFEFEGIDDRANAASLHGSDNQTKCCASRASPTIDVVGRLLSLS